MFSIIPMAHAPLQTMTKASEKKKKKKKKKKKRSVYNCKRSCTHNVSTIGTRKMTKLKMRKQREKNIFRIIPIAHASL